MLNEQGKEWWWSCSGNSFFFFFSFTRRDGGNIATLAYLINQKIVDVDIRGKFGYNLLHRACICDFFDSEDDSMDSEHDLHDKVSELNAEKDTILCQIVEMIAERCVQQVLDETTAS
jgi:hypothetical protein